MSTETATKAPTISEALQLLYRALRDHLEEIGQCELTGEEVQLLHGRLKEISRTVLDIAPEYARTVAESMIDQLIADKIAWHLCCEPDCTREAVAARYGLPLCEVHDLRGGGTQI